MVDSVTAGSGLDCRRRADPLLRLLSPGHTTDECPGRSTMSLSPPEIVFAAGFVVVFTIRAVYGRHRRKRTMVDVRVDLIERSLLAAVSIGMLVVPAFFLFSPWLGFADFAAPDWLAWPGAVLMVVSLILFWRSHVDLGRNWTPVLQIRKEHALVTRGVYKFLRHPMYAAHWLWGIAQALLLQNWLAGPALLICFLPLYLFRASREERMLLEHFGDEYRAYRSRTGRIIPLFWTSRRRPS